MRMILPPRRVALYVVCAIPFVLLPVGSAWSVGPLARMGARWCEPALVGLSLGADTGHVAAMSEENAAAENAAASEESAYPLTDERAPLAHEAHASPHSGMRAQRERPSEVATSRLSGAKRAAGDQRARSNVFVGPDSIKRAIPVTGRPTSAWTDRTVEHPAGLLIQSPGALRGVIEPGDILVEAEGQMLGSFEQLLATVRQAYERRAKRLSGRLFRRGDMVPVTVEPGW
jgi:hypothetical protein